MKKVMPKTNYRVFGYNDMCEDFEYENLTFIKACQLFIKLDRNGMNVVFIDGVSSEVSNKLHDWMFTHR